ncbi:MAG: Rrf2 family transcriptional regulator [Proteobacteria bacterium]|nr:Rrf2 family transcriptional regulator [Pseudomonadota bacterium]HQR04088.1 Rrf2 family transcriptional regulator [Rhodocyclaceae bacterium]
MRLTVFTDYTLRVLMYLALEPTRRSTIAEIAAAYGISEHHLTKVAHRLGQSGAIETLRGKSGGIRLAQAPEDIRLGSVVRICEGGMAIVECLDQEVSPPCRIAPACRLAGILEEGFEALYKALDAYTLADLVAQPRRLHRLLRQEA